MKIKENGFKVLNGMSLGIVVALIPGAIFGQLTKLFDYSLLQNAFDLSTALMCFMIGICIAIQYKFDGISTMSLALATFISGGAFKGVNDEGMLMVKGTGDVINAALGAILALLIIKYLDPRLKTYKLLVLPVVSIVIVTIITNFTAQPVSLITYNIGQVISLFTSLQPLVMSILLALSFSLIIISPLSTVAIALLISISGLSSGAANLGIVGTSFTLALLSYKENGLGCALVHFIGSPKIQMANFIKRPIMFIPSLFSAFLCGIISYLFAIQGTPISAGFGISGLIGPLAHLSSEGFTSFNLFIVLIAFVILPIIISISSMYLFRNILKLVKPEDYKINI